MNVLLECLCKVPNLTIWSTLAVLTTTSIQQRSIVWVELHWKYNNLPLRKAVESDNFSCFVHAYNTRSTSRHICTMVVAPVWLCHNNSHMLHSHIVYVVALVKLLIMTSENWLSASNFSKLVVHYQRKTPWTWMMAQLSQA